MPKLSEEYRAARRAYKQTPQWRRYFETYQRGRYAEFCAFLAEQKAGPCVDCGNTYPSCVMDFDHVRGVKRRDVGLMSTYARAAVLAEIAKCDLVCANCHRIRTHARGTNRRENPCKST